ncbi:MAG: lasso peptide biosynthesis B2 protein, partial [Okeania sp. SIO2D1]|nr:lasso peptide biosynthesis B2 protein [Okeania sp. SIO2D1]
MKRWHKFWQFSGTQRLLLLSSFSLLGLVRLGLWLLPFPTLRRLVTKLSQVRLWGKGSELTTEQIIWAVNLSSRYMPAGVKCLARALTVQLMMSWAGYASQLRIGVAKGEAGQLEAHAWVEFEGKVVIGELG